MVVPTTSFNYSHSRVVCNIPYIILNSVILCRIAEFCMIASLTLDRFADRTIVAYGVIVF